MPLSVILIKITNSTDSRARSLNKVKVLEFENKTNIMNMIMMLNMEVWQHISIKKIQALLFYYLFYLFIWVVRA